MMFRLLAAWGLIALAACTPAKGLVVHYDKEGRKDGMLVMVAANGDARLIAGDSGIIRNAGTDYVILRAAEHLKGKRYGLMPVAVARDELVAHARSLAATRPRGPLPGMQPSPAAYRMPDGRAVRVAPPPRPRFEAVEAGSETVAGIAGMRWRIRLKDRPELWTHDVVVSADPAHAAAGTLVAAFLAPGDLAAAQGADADALLPTLARVLAKGMALRVSQNRNPLGPEAKIDLFRVAGVEHVRLDPTNFALPERRADREALRRGAYEKAGPDPGAIDRAIELLDRAARPLG